MGVFGYLDFSYKKEYNRYSFRRVVPKPIQRIKRVDATGELVGHWIVERDVHFYIRDRLIGVVTLRGMKLDRRRDRQEGADRYGRAVLELLLRSGLTLPPSRRCLTTRLEVPPEIFCRVLRKGSG